MKNINYDYKHITLILNKTKIEIYYNDVLIDTKRGEYQVLNSLKKIKKYDNLDKKIPILNIVIINKKDMYYYINNGFIIIITDKAYAIECRTKVDNFNLNYEKGMFGSNTSFTENFNDNLYLIRNRIKDESLKSLTFDMGTISHTKCSILYIENIVNKDKVKKVYKRLREIKIDGILDSCYIKDYLNKLSLFPTITSTVRPDKASSMLLEGKIIIISDNSPNAIILPNIFIDFFHAMDDYYSSYIFASFIRTIRFISFLISIFLPSIYMLIVLNDYKFINKHLLNIVKEVSKGAIFNIFLQNIFLIIIFNILRESDLHKNKDNSTSFSLLGGLILGSTASISKFVSPLSLVVVSLSTISALVFDSYEFQNSLNIIKILTLIITYILGFKGLIISVIIIFIVLVFTKSFGVNYLYPFIPFDKKAIIDTLFRIKVHKKYRNKIITNNIKRGKIWV